MSALNDQLIAAHAARDHAKLVALYTQAGDETADLDTACFFLTHAYVFALEQGHPDADTLHARLAAHGRV